MDAATGAGGRALRPRTPRRPWTGRSSGPRDGVRRFAEQHAERGDGVEGDGVDGDEAADDEAPAAPPPVDAVVEHLGRYGAKVVLVGADGRFGELVVDEPARARLACELAGATVHDGFDRELSARMRQSEDEWSRMGGGSARVPSSVADSTA